MLVAVAVGLLLHLSGPAPSASHWVLVMAGPLLAFVGAALYTGSVFHPHNASVDPAPDDGPVAAADLRPGGLPGGDRRPHRLDGGGGHRRALGLRAAGVQSAPAGRPVRLPLRTGDDGVRWGWFFLPVGLVLALLIR